MTLTAEQYTELVEAAAGRAFPLPRQPVWLICVRCSQPFETMQIARLGTCCRTRHDADEYAYGDMSGS